MVLSHLSPGDQPTDILSKSKMSRRKKHPDLHVCFIILISRPFSPQHTTSQDNYYPTMMKVLRTSAKSLLLLVLFVALVEASSLQLRRRLEEGGDGTEFDPEATEPTFFDNLVSFLTGAYNIFDIITGIVSNISTIVDTVSGRSGEATP